MYKNFKKLISAVLCFVLVFTSMFVVQIMGTEKASAATVVSSIVKNSDGKGYLQVDGKPFLYQGIENLGIVQCLCDQANSPFATPMPTSWLENDFEKTQALGYKTIQVVLQWSDIEHTNTPGVYDWSLVDKYVE